MIHTLLLCTLFAAPSAATEPCSDKKWSSGNLVLAGDTWFCKNLCDSGEKCNSDSRCAMRCAKSCFFCSEGNQYFVSVDGSDSWDGTGKWHINNSDTGPWKTLNHAINKLRKIRPNPPTTDSHVTITLLPGTHFLTSTVSMGPRDSYITIKALDGEDVAVSGGLVLDGDWTEEEGGIRTTTFQGSCGEAYVGAQRLVPARSTNLISLTPNVNLAAPPYETMKGLLKETETCKRDSTSYSQDCPDEDRMGFVFDDEFSADWQHLDQTKVLVFHSGIAEYATMKLSIEKNTLKDIRLV